jgi:hypothetical protein
LGSNGKCRKRRRRRKFYFPFFPEETGEDHIKVEERVCVAVSALSLVSMSMSVLLLLKFLNETTLIFL